MIDPRPFGLEPLGWTGPQLLVIGALVVACFAAFVLRSKRQHRLRIVLAGDMKRYLQRRSAQGLCQRYGRPSETGTARCHACTVAAREGNIARRHARQHRQAVSGGNQ